MTKKRWIILAAMAAGVIALIAGCIVLLNSPKETYEVNGMRLFGISSDQIKSISINTPDSDVEIYRGDDGLLHFTGSDEPVDQGRAESIVTFTAYMYVTKEVEEDAEDLVKYGLEPPESVITVTLDDGTQYVINYGSLSTDRTARYLTLNDERTVYTQGEISSQIILKDLDSLRDLNLPEHNVELLSGIAYQNFMGEQIVMSELPAQMHIGDCTFQMNEPAALFVPKGNIDAFKAVYATAEFFEYKGNEILPEYGLENPKIVQFAFSDGVLMTLYVGAKEDGANRYYVMADGKEGIYTLSGNALEFMNYPALRMAYSGAVPASAQDTAQIDLNYNGSRYVIKSENGVYTINGKEITEQQYTELFALLAAVQIIDFTDEALITEETAAVIGITTKEGAELEIEFNNYGSEFVSVDYGAGAQVYCSRSKLTDFLQKAVEYAG